METSAANRKINLGANDFHHSFMKTVLSNVPDTHTLLPAQYIEHLKRHDFPKSQISRHLIHNDTAISERLAEFCTWHGISSAVPESFAVPLASPHCYFLSVDPSANYTGKQKTRIPFSGKIYTFQGFVLITDQELQVTPLSFQQFGYNYLVKVEPIDKAVLAFSKIEALLFEEYLFNGLLQLFDFTHVLKCLNSTMMFIPSFRNTDMQVLAVSDVLRWLIKMRQSLPLYIQTELKEKIRSDISETIDGWIVTNPHLCPSSVRIDRVEWPRQRNDKGLPSMIHFSSLFNEETEAGCDALRVANKEALIRVSTEDFLLTGFYTDVVQHALLLPLMVHHILYHKSLLQLETKLNYSFRDRQLLERALTQPSFSQWSTVFAKEVEVTGSNCGARRPLVRAERKSGAGKGIKAKIICAASQSERERLRHNEQLEFLGDAALEYLCSLHLYHMFPDAKVGQLASYRTLLVKNRHLATVAQRLEIHKYLLMGDSQQNGSGKHKQSPGPSPDSGSATPEQGTVACMDTEAHTSANTLEAVLGAVYLDSGLAATQLLMARLFFPEEELQRVWLDYPPHPLQVDRPAGDRHLIPQSPILQKLVELEESTGVRFRHIRLLAKAFTHSSMQYSHLVGGSYEKLEHLGDAVLQFLASDYLYHRFPTLHEGTCSLLRSTLVQNKQLAELCKQLGFDQYIRTETPEVGVKILADVVESYLAALLLDKGLDYCRKFLEACLFPKLMEILESSDIEDPNTRLQKTTARCCRQLQLEYEQPIYRQLGSSQNPPFTVGVYFKGKRLGTGVGSSLRDARQGAAEQALEKGILRQLSREKK